MTAEDLSGRRLGGFSLEELLGEGSYGSVWRARQVRLDRDVAVKVLDPLIARDPTAARRFEREGRSAASLDHPAIVPVYEAGDDDGLYYLAMRLVDGETLADTIDRQAPMPRADVVRLLSPVAAALDHAHASGLIHRDVKPANILIEDDHAYLSDFGIAASAREMGRYTTGSIGTAEYMSPEQARGEEVDHRSDLYALGCVAFHALTGDSPFRRDDIIGTLLAHTADEVPTTRSADLDSFFFRALAKEPDSRYDTGSEFMAALEGDVAGSVGARRRNPLRVALLAGLATVVVLATVGFVVVSGGDEASAPGITSGSIAGSSGPATSVPASTVAASTAATAATTATSSAIEAPEIRQGGRIAVGTNLSLDNPNPHSSLDMSKVISEWVLPVLYAVDTDLNLVPSLATGPPVADPDDPLTLTWTLRDDIEWDDGTAVTANDVVATYAYLSAPDTNATNLLLYDSLTSVEAVDQVTLRMRLSEPNGAARLLFSTIHPVIKSQEWEDHLAAGGTAADFLDDGIDFSAGPYRVAPNPGGAGQIELVPNPGWTGDPDDRPALDAVTLTSYNTSEGLIEALSIGQADLIWVEDVGTGDVTDAAAIPESVVAVGTSDLSLQMTMNTRSPILADERARQAIMHAIDREGIADTAVGRITNSIAPPRNSLVFAPGQSGNAMPFDDSFDVAEAGRLLDEAGWLEPPEGGTRVKDGQPLELALVLLNTNDNIAAALEIQDDLRDVGVNTIAVTGTSAETNDRTNTGDFDLLLQFRLFNSDPVATKQVFGTVGCPSAISGCSGRGVNVGAFSDPEIDALLDLADAETDQDVRLQLYTEIDALLRQRVPAVPLFVFPAFTAHGDDLLGVVMSPNRGPLASLADWGFAVS